VAAVIVWAIRTGKPDVYTRVGAREGVINYYSRIGEDPEANASQDVGGIAMR
jgi:hypothetical protein